MLVGVSELAMWFRSVMLCCVLVMTHEHHVLFSCLGGHSVLRGQMAHTLTCAFHLFHQRAISMTKLPLLAIPCNKPAPISLPSRLSSASLQAVHLEIHVLPSLSVLLEYTVVLAKHLSVSDCSAEYLQQLHIFKGEKEQ